MLQKIINLIDAWFESNQQDATGLMRPQDIARSAALDHLRSRIQTEIEAVIRCGGPDVPQLQSSGASAESTLAPHTPKKRPLYPPPQHRPPPLPHPSGQHSKVGPEGATARNPKPSSHYAELEFPKVETARPKKLSSVNYADIDIAATKKLMLDFQKSGVKRERTPISGAVPTLGMGTAGLEEERPRIFEAVSDLVEEDSDDEAYLDDETYFKLQEELRRKKGLI